MTEISFAPPQPPIIADVAAAIRSLARERASSPARVSMLCAIGGLLADEERFGKIFKPLEVVGDWAIAARPFFHKVPADFYLHRGRIAIVCSASEARRDILGRLRRLAARQGIAGLVLVTCMRSHGSLAHVELGKPLLIVSWSSPGSSSGP